jgi:hypothetical protein
MEAASKSRWLIAQKGSWVQIKVADLPKWKLASNQGRKKQKQPQNYTKNTQKTYKNPIKIQRNYIK